MTATQWLEMLLSFSLQVFVVTLASSALERWLVRPSDRCSIWSTCFVSILVLGGAGLLLPRLHLLRPWVFAEPETLIAAAAVERRIAEALVSVWCIGATFALAKWMLRGVLLRHSVKHCEQLPPEQIRELLGSGRRLRSEDELPTVLISDHANGPYCFQLHQATIVVPRLLLEGTRDDLRNVLFHELAHLQGNHPVQLFLQQLAHVICWFHPAVWRASARASLMREYSCDDAVVDEGVKCAAYLRTLLRIAERNERLSQQGAIAFGRTPTELMLRAKRLVELAHGKQTVGRGMRLLGKPAAVAILLAVTCLMTQVSIPSDPMSSSRTAWSTWPTWSAQCLHCFGVTVRDYEVFDRRIRPYEQVFDGGGEDTLILEPVAQSP